MPSLASMSIKVSMLKRSIRPRMRSAMPGEIEVILRCPSRPLLERVKNVDRLGELGDVEHSMLHVGMNFARESPSQTTGFSFMTQYTRTCMSASIKDRITAGVSGPARRRPLSLIVEQADQGARPGRPGALLQALHR